MDQLNQRPDQHTVARLGELVEDLPFAERIPRRSGDVAFDEAWEIRAFSIATALHTEGRFEWPEFQSRLISSIERWESENSSTNGRDWSYYERWMLALEEVVESRGMVTPDEIDRRTKQILETPANANHQHAVREPITVSPAASTAHLGERWPIDRTPSAHS